MFLKYFNLNYVLDYSKDPEVKDLKNYKQQKSSFENRIEKFIEKETKSKLLKLIKAIVNRYYQKFKPYFILYHISTKKERYGVVIVSILHTLNLLIDEYLKISFLLSLNQILTAYNILKVAVLMLIKMISRCIVKKAVFHHISLIELRSFIKSRTRKTEKDINLENFLNEVPEGEIRAILYILYQNLEQISYLFLWWFYFFYFLIKVFKNFGNLRSLIGLAVLQSFYLISFFILLNILLIIIKETPSSQKSFLKRKKLFWSTRFEYHKALFELKSKRHLINSNKYHAWAKDLLLEKCKKHKLADEELTDERLNLQNYTLITSSLAIGLAPILHVIVDYLFVGSMSLTLEALKTYLLSKNFLSFYNFYLEKSLLNYEILKETILINQIIFNKWAYILILESLEQDRLNDYIQMLDTMKEVKDIKEVKNEDLKYEDFKVRGQTISYSKLSPKKYISVNDLYKDKAEIITAKEGINFELIGQEKIVLVAPSGFGKSLLLSSIGGLGGSFSEGKYFFKEEEYTQEELFHHTYLIPPKIEFMEISLRENLNLKCKNSDEEIRELLEIYGFKSDSLNLDKIYTNSSYSEGEKKRLALVRMECELKNRKNNCLLLLDEVFSNLDQINLKKALERLKLLPYPAIIVSHEKQVQEAFRKVYIEPPIQLETSL